MYLGGFLPGPRLSAAARGLASAGDRAVDQHGTDRHGDCPVGALLRTGLLGGRCQALWAGLVSLATFAYNTFTFDYSTVVTAACELHPVGDVVINAVSIPLLLLFVMVVLYRELHNSRRLSRAGRSVQRGRFGDLPGPLLFLPSPRTLSCARHEPVQASGDSTGPAPAHKFTGTLRNQPRVTALGVPEWSADPQSCGVWVQ